MEWKKYGEKERRMVVGEEENQRKTGELNPLLFIQ